MRINMQAKSDAGPNIMQSSPQRAI